MKRIVTILLFVAALFTAYTAKAQAPQATPEEAITGLLNRIGGKGAADLFEIVIDPTIADNGKDAFVITAQDGKPCIKGNTQLSVATGINWYLNHYAHINLTWNNLTTDLTGVELPVPTKEEKHVCNTTYRYNFNTCTFSYSMAFWTWERWQQEIDWMALHGINAPLNLVGLDVVTRKFLRELNVSEEDINKYIAGPGFIAWFAMNNLEGWGGTISATDVNMNGNPDWWYTRQEQLCRDMLQRMRELGMQPVIPGFSGQVPNCIVNYTIEGFNKNDVVNNGTWAGGYERPDILKPNTTSYATFAPIYYKHLHEVMGVSELYSMDPFHEGSLPSGVSNETCYPNIMKHLDTYHDAVETEEKNSYRVNSKAKWIIQYWQGVPQSGAFSAMSSYGDRFIGLDLFADNIYADNAAKWRTSYYNGRPYIYCMLHNFGGRSGLHGRLETTMNGYFDALEKNNNCQGIGATPEGIETNPVLYDMLFELPWINPSTRPTADEWLSDYAHARYGISAEEAPNALAALQNLKKSVWNCKNNQQGTSEAVILARPDWSIAHVSSWSTSAIYWDTQDVLLAADQLYSIKDLITTDDGIANYNYDFIDVVRQAMVDYAAQLLPLINAARNNNTEYERLYKLYLQLMLDLDEMLSYDENFKLERWTSLARNIAGEVDGTTENDRRWLEWNARTQITVWSKGNTDLHDYSNRCWAGLIKDFHYKRWEKFFTTKGGSFDGGWFDGFEYPWTVDFTNYDYSKVEIPKEMSATEKAAETFGKYFGRVKGNEKNYIFPMGITSNSTKKDVIPEISRGKTAELPLIIGKNVAITEVKIDLNGDGIFGNGEKLVPEGMNINIPAEASIGKSTARVTFKDGTDITFSLAIVEEITKERTVTVTTNLEHGTVAIEGAEGNSITNKEAVKITATAKTGYNFNNWTDDKGNVISNDNPLMYYGKDDATFTANFIQDEWGVPEMTTTGLNDAITNNQYVNNISFAYHNREAETIYDATNNIPTSLFTTIPQIINIPRGASFTISWTDNSTQDLTKCFMSAYMDFDRDGNFEEEGEIVKVAGTRNADNAQVRNGNFQIILPYDMPKGITHLRMRFDSAWGDQYNSTTQAFNSKGKLDRMCYEIILNITDGSDKAAHIEVKSNNDEWGKAECWTDETPGWTASNKWDVSTGILLHIKATPDSDDVEFLGWYDQYDRLLTTEFEYKRLAIEDATYTAKFRKQLDFDGWSIQYRIQPGKTVTKKLANGEKPENGKTYYIYAPTNFNNVTATRYLYDNNGNLATNTSANGNNYLWTCIVNSDNTYSFKNSSGNYLANNGSYHLSIGGTAAKYVFEDPSQEGITIKNAANYTGGKYMVTKHDGSAFNRNGEKTNGEWCSDYVFTEVSTPNEVVLTKVLQTGDGDLVIPETVEILDQELTIVGFDNNLFNNKKELTSITMPKTMQFVSDNTLYDCIIEGSVANATGKYAENDNNFIIKELGEKKISSANGWIIEINGKTNGNTFNQWGSALIATGKIPMHEGNSSFPNGFQIYLGKNGEVTVKINDGTERKLNGLTIENEFKATIEYEKKNVKITVESNGKSADVTVEATMNDIEALSSAIPTGITLDISIKSITIPNPFSGCCNLDRIAIDGDCEAYEVKEDGGLYNSNDVLICMPEGKEKGAERRKLGALIEEMKALTAQVATYNPTGKETEITLTTEQGKPNYIWCSNPHTGNNDDAKGGVAALLDEDPNTYLHTNYSSISQTYDYLQIEFGSAEAGLKKFKIAGQQRHNASTDFPKIIEVQGSTDKSQWTTIATVTGLQNTKGATWSSDVISSEILYPYLRFVVKTHTNENNIGRPYFHMAKFDLFKISSSASVFNVFENTELSNDFAAAKYDVLLDAINVYDNGTTAQEMEDARTNLQTAYDELLKEIGIILPFKLTTDEENPVLYKIFIKRTADTTVLKYDESTKKVAIENKADNSSYQAWYFMNNTNGFFILSYNGDGKVLSADETSNGAEKVSAAEKGEKTFQEWTLLKQTDDYYNIRAHNGCYLSNFGGTSNKMGFWNGDGNESKTQSDDGSQFKFIDAEFANDNPRYYQLSDFKGTCIDGTEIYGGTSVGLYTGGKEYREAYTAAAALVTAGNSSDSIECYNAYKDLRATNEILSYNVADPNKLYVIKSTASKDYCKGKYVHTLYESTSGYDQRHMKFASQGDIPQFPLAVFQFETTAKQDEYKLKNLHTGLYVKSYNKNVEHMGDANSAAVIKIAGIADGQVTLKIGDNRPMHAQDANRVIVDWNAEKDNASTWSIDEVKEITYVCHNATLGEVGYSTLYLNYPVTIPAGITVYTANEIKDNKWLSMKEVSGTIPARTAVILNGDPGTYPFIYAKETRAVVDNIFKGTLWKQTITRNNNDAYYILANQDLTPDDGKDNKVVGFYKPKSDEDFVSSANKAYLHIPAVATAQQSAFFSLRFEDGTTTGIEDLFDEEVRPAMIFDLQGRRILNIENPGLYIINGRKVLVK